MVLRKENLCSNVFTIISECTKDEIDIYDLVEVPHYYNMNV